MKELHFIKKMNRWYIDIPYDGDSDDLEMVSGADTLLEILSYGNDEVSLKIYENEVANAIICTKIDETDIGSTYIVDNWDYMECTYNGTIWLCNVTKLIFGEFPEIFYVRF